ncbi:conserved hypothetical protein [Cenarchaeum symbiosum A]|uniref:Membrane-associated protein n=1 Tax=Cenarchaeum symbiosum (strain A) TaxID=414004 RepID=A0RXF5_CENSY|nr:conserved hypothetical protein [Cenarchaeum symbiosum A]
MADLIEVVAELSYLGIFPVLVALNAVPILVPPTWIILSSFYAVDPTLDPLALALVGATAATIGRLVLKQTSGLFRRFAGPEQEANLDAIGGYLGKKRYGYALASFLFASTPLPSNMLFVAYGLMKARGAALYAGFWAGRAISYYVMISVAEVVLLPLLDLFEDRLVGILVADGMGVALVVLFACINWKLLITKKRIGFTRPKLWRL